MALMNDQKIDKRSKEYKQMMANNTSNSVSEETQPQNTVSNATDPRDILIQQMQQQMQKMEERLNSVDRPKTDWAAASKHYDGPREYNFRLWDGKPICSAVSKKNDATKPFVGKNGESNHILVLTFHDDTTAEVNIDDFGANFVHSPKMEAEVITNPRNSKEVLGYRFTTSEFGTFTVIPGMIN